MSHINWEEKICKRRKYRQQGTHPPCDTLKWPGLNPIKVVHSPVPARWLAQQTAKSFSQLRSVCQQSWSKCCCYAKLSDFSPAMVVTIASTYWSYPHGLARLSWSGWLVKCGDSVAAFIPERFALIRVWTFVICGICRVLWFTWNIGYMLQMPLQQSSKVSWRFQ